MQEMRDKIEYLLFQYRGSDLNRVEARINVATEILSLLKKEPEYSGLSKDGEEPHSELETPLKELECGTLNACEITLEFFREYLEMPKGTLEELCQEIIRLKKKEPEQKIEELYISPDDSNRKAILLIENKLCEIIRTLNAEK